jgi:hypothetical protein
MTKDAAQRRRWTFYEAINHGNNKEVTGAGIRVRAMN